MSDNFISQAITCLANILNCNPQELSPIDTISSVKKWDSLNHMRLILSLEEDIGRQIETEEAMALFSVEDIAAFLKNNAP